MNEDDFYTDALTGRIVATGKTMPLEVLLFGKLLRSLVKACDDTGFSYGAVGLWTLVHDQYRFWGLDEIQRLTGLHSDALERALGFLVAEGLVEHTQEGVRALASGHDRRVALASRFVASLDRELQEQLRHEAEIYERVGPHIRPMELLAGLLLVGASTERLDCVAAIVSARDESIKNSGRSA